MLSGTIGVVGIGSDGGAGLIIESDSKSGAGSEVAERLDRTNRIFPRGSQIYIITDNPISIGLGISNSAAMIDGHGNVHRPTERCC